MADPLILAAYAAAKFLQKGRREDAAAAAELKEQQKAEAKAAAEARVTPYGRMTPDGPIQQLNILDKNFANYTVTHRRFGTGEIKEVAPDEQTFPLFQLPDGKRGIKSELEKSIVSRAGRFGTWDDLKATHIGTRDVKGNKYTDNFDPEYLRPEKPKNVFVFEGADKKGNQIFGRTVQEVREKGGVEGSIGQKSVTPDVATALGFSGSVLSTEKKAFITPAPKADPKKPMRYVGEMEDGRIIYADSAAELRDKKAVRVGEAQFTVQDDEPIRTGKITWLTPDKKTEESEQFATVYKLDENGERIDDKQIDIPLWQYRENTSKYQPVVGYEKDETGARKTIDIGIKSASELKGAMDLSTALFDIKHKDKVGKKQHFVISAKPPGITSQKQLTIFRNWIENLPRKADVTPDWITAGFDDDGITKMRNYAVNLVAANTTVKDPITNEMVQQY